MGEGRILRCQNAVRTLSEHCQNAVRTLSERPGLCQNICGSSRNQAGSSQTVCNFFQLLAWERLMLNPARLYPTARLQIVRDLFFREWQARALRSQPRTPNLVCGAPADYLESTAF